MHSTRRSFLADVGRGMLVAGVGPALVADLGLGSVRADDAPETLTFGDLEPLVVLMQDTAPDRLLPKLVDRLKGGADLRQLTAAAALANARCFGGEDYVGFHTMMALAPAYHMARELPTERQPLPLLKVLYRNANRIQEVGGRKHEVLHPVRAAAPPADKSGAEALRDAVHRKDVAAAEGTLAALARGKPEDALNGLLPTVEEQLEVHRVVLPARVWDLLGIIGREHAQTLLRQSVRYCVRAQHPNSAEMFGGARALLPKLLDQYKLPGRAPGRRAAEDGWVEKMSQTLFGGTPEQAADAAAAALAEGMAPDAVGEALSLAANQLVLRDAGRPQGQTAPNKPVGSVHGDGIGVHACDSANAWRNLARVAEPRQAVACLILGAYQVAFDRTHRGGDFLKWEAYPTAAARDALKGTGAEALLGAAEDAIKHNDQAAAAAAVHRYGAEGHAPRPVFDLLLRYAVSEDGALHAEKYYRTVTEEFAATRPALRWRQLVALARVTASEHGYPAPGHAEARRLLGV
jgi:hypothetical protein